MYPNYLESQIKGWDFQGVLGGVQIKRRGEGKQIFKEKKIYYTFLQRINC